MDAQIQEKRILVLYKGKVRGLGPYLAKLQPEPEGNLYFLSESSRVAHKALQAILPIKPEPVVVPDESLLRKLELLGEGICLRRCGRRSEQCDVCVLEEFMLNLEAKQLKGDDQIGNRAVSAKSDSSDQ